VGVTPCGGLLTRLRSTDGTGVRAWCAGEKDGKRAARINGRTKKRKKRCPKSQRFETKTVGDFQVGQVGTLSVGIDQRKKDEQKNLEPM